MTATTTPSLEDTLRHLASRGEISHISLAPSQKGKLWRASFAMCSKFGVSYAEDADPATAIILACNTAKLKRRAPIKVDGKLVEASESIPQEIVEVEPESYVSPAQADEYLAGIQAKTAAAESIDDLM